MKSISQTTINLIKEYKPISNDMLMIIMNLNDANSEQLINEIITITIILTKMVYIRYEYFRYPIAYNMHHLRRVTLTITQTIRLVVLLMNTHECRSHVNSHLPRSSED